MSPAKGSWRKLYKWPSWPNGLPQRATLPPMNTAKGAMPMLKFYDSTTYKPTLPANKSNKPKPGTYS